MGFLTTAAMMLLANEGGNASVGIDMFTGDLCLNTGGDFGINLRTGGLEYEIGPGFDVTLF
jgi:hypothetical protein